MNGDITFEKNKIQNLDGSLHDQQETLLKLRNELLKNLNNNYAH
jgi:hypothetical protein